MTEHGSLAPWVAAQAAILAALAAGATALAVSHPGIPGLGLALDTAYSMAILAFAGGVGMRVAIKPSGRPAHALAWGLAFAATALAYGPLYAALGAGNVFVAGMEYLYLAAPAIAAALLVLQGVRRRSLAAPAGFSASVLLVFILQLPLHTRYAEPAALEIYNTPALIASQATSGVAPSELGLQPAAAALKNPEIHRPQEVLDRIAAISKDQPAVRHAWTMRNSLPNLPDAEVLIFYDGTASPAQAWVLPPDQMTAGARHLLVAHLLITVWLGAALLACGLAPLILSTQRNFR